MEKTKKGAQKLGIKSITDIVFDLDDGYKGILHILAKYGEQSIWNMTKLSRDRHTKWELNQKRIYRRLLGTVKLFSLLEKEYVIEHTFEEKVRDHPKKTYTLTLKGMLAALSTDIAIDEIKQFQNYIEFACSKVTDDKLKTLIKNYIKGQIHVFLVWHAMHGIQLQMQTGSNEYFSYFFKNFIELPAKTGKNNKYREIYRTHLKKFLVTHTTISMLDFIADPNREIGIQEESDSTRQNLYEQFTSAIQFDRYTPNTFQKTGEFVIGLIQKWPLYIQHLYQESKRNTIRITDVKDPVYLDEKENDSSKIVLETPTYDNKVLTNLKEFMNEKTADALMMYFIDKEFESEFRLYRQTRFP